jgi:hypothetical protein
MMDVPTRGFTKVLCIPEAKKQQSKILSSKY